MGKTKRRTPNRRRGAAAVELAFVSPFLVLIAFGGVELGLFINLSQITNNASREGARKASRNDTLTVTEVEAVVHDYLDNAAGIPTSAVQVTVVDGAGASIAGGDLTTIGSGNAVSVEVTVQFESARWISFLEFLNEAENSTTTITRRE